MSGERSSEDYLGGVANKTIGMCIEVATSIAGRMQERNLHALEVAITGMFIGAIGAIAHGMDFETFISGCIRAYQSSEKAHRESVDNAISQIGSQVDSIFRARRGQ